MKKTLFSCLFLLGATLFQVTYSQELTGTAAAEKIKGATRIRMNSAGTVPTSITFQSSYSIDERALKESLFGTRTDDVLYAVKVETDELGITHSRYQQQYKGLNVDGNVYLFHSRNGRIVSANGQFLPGINLSISPTLSESQALDAALNNLKQPLAKENLESSDIELVVVPYGSSAILAYKCGIISHQPTVVNQLVYVDASSGKVLKEMNRICSFDVQGTGHSQFSGVQTMITDSLSPTNYQLHDHTRGDGIQTVSAATQAYYSDNDNDWNNVNTDLDQYAVDAHFGAEATYDFFRVNFGRESYDDNGGVIKSHVNDVGVGVNAYWEGGAVNEMHYGNGDDNYFPVVSLEVVGHELSHGVTEYSAGLIYAGESGALNESFSDIFGNTIRFLSAPDSASWYIGDQLLRPGGVGFTAFRNMANPNEFENADTYGGLYFNNGDIVHYDSGIQNFWYYLLVEGGTGVNDIGNAYTVNSIGMNDAMRIAYRNLAYYLTPSSTFMDARDGAEQAAADLFGPCSVQLEETIHAWYAVGVGPETSGAFTLAIIPENNFACSAPLTANFSTNYVYDNYLWDFGDGTTSTDPTPSHVYTNDGTYTVTLEVTSTSGGGCEANTSLVDAVVIDEIDPIADFTTSENPTVDDPTQFTDESLYGPTAWEWNFGDGGTSTLQNPTHTYTTDGSYTVQLIVHNCHGTDTITSQIEVIDFILFCETTFTDKPQGLIYDSGGENGNYLDNESCGLLIQPCNATSITLTIEELSIENSYDYLIIHDGDNVSMPIIAVITGNFIQGPITTTSGGMFIEFNSDFTITDFGFKMSYVSTMAAPGSIVPIYTAYPNIPMSGQPVQFVDETPGVAVAWAWDFGDGETSTLQDPVHTYATTGIKTVTLTVTFCDGSTATSTTTIVVSGVGIDELTAVNAVLTVAPNPFSESFEIQSKESIRNLQLRVMDMSGREVYNYDEHHPATGIVVSPGSLSTGQYLLEAVYEHENGTPGLERFKLQVIH